ncbi:MAG: phospho-sugar mutase [Nitriliruptoraceae bacterium]
MTLQVLMEDEWMDAELIDRARDWIASDPDPVTRDELQAVVDTGDAAQVAAYVGGALEFGTAGLRGVVGAGPMRMNQAVVIRTTRGLADCLVASDPTATERGVVVGFDARHDSARFARTAVSVLAGAGIRVHRFPTVQPTPIVAYAQKVLDAAAAIMITASHNPPEYNGYKVYVEGASQIVPPTDAAIAAAIEHVGAANQVPVVDPDNHELIHDLDDRVLAQYLADLPSARPQITGPDRRIVYTPLHGVGGPLVLRALADAGYHDVHVVSSQAEPDGDFPTVAFPNPEEPGAMDASIDLATHIEADLVIANDPDADRLAIAVPDGDTFRLLTGNQIGVLLADHLLRHSDIPRPLVAASIVSSPMLASVAANYGAHAEFTLTGFKWIAAAVRELEGQGYDFVFGFEEALGSMVGTVVRDKDGISAAVVFADLVRSLAAEGLSVDDRWRQLSQRDGLWVSHQLSITRPGVEGKSEIDAAMAHLSDNLPDDLAGHPVKGVTDFRHGADKRPAWLTTHDLVVFDLADGRAMIRPSGTEPKVKIYVDVRGNLGDDDDFDAEQRSLDNAAREVAESLAAFVGLTPG